MAQTSISRTKSKAKTTGKKEHSEFYRNVILPSKTYKAGPLLETKDVALTYKKQPSLGKVDIEKHRNSLQRELSIDMLRQGYHQSFRELSTLLAWQKEDRERLATEHPLYRRPLLDEEPDKLRFLCVYLNKAEEAERKCQYSNMFKSYLEVASFFIKSDDYWLSDFFHKKCLSLTETYSQLDSELSSQAYFHVGLSYERQGYLGDLLKALEYFEKYREFGGNYYEGRINANHQLVRIYTKLAERQSNTDALKYITKAYEASIQTDDKKVESSISYKLGLIYLEHNDIDSALKYLEQYYNYCEQENDHEGFGQASEALAICYQRKSNVEKSTKYLTKYLQKVSTNANDKQYVKACSALGLIDAALGNYDSARKYSKKAYSISLNKKYPDLDRYRVLYGIADGLKLQSFFKDRIDQMNTHALLEWKLTRFENYLIKSKP
ncbi:unnamed protein product [Adineta steineri]|uniref:Tetratricopeptide repeat protein 29 n=1 Tax=Adineta steineri TaxID=433720 RepID=A0A813ZRL7_9BILA|nr:unnamed protein product [Adineta steineri]CAF1246088.1 unnamed protein product [Adineta steineri]